VARHHQQEPGWEDTLTGVPKEIYQLWAKYFRQRGYELKRSSNFPAASRETWA
jgi:hypothetical protein